MTADECVQTYKWQVNIDHDVALTSSSSWSASVPALQRHLHLTYYTDGPELNLFNIKFNETLVHEDTELVNFVIFSA